MKASLAEALVSMRELNAADWRLAKHFGVSPAVFV